MNPTVIEILTEEVSMEIFLRGLLPKILPNNYALDENCFIRPHEGKSDLRKSIPRKMKVYPHFGYPIKVVILHDQDSNDCKKLKAELVELTKNNSELPVLIRIACRELENWYLGDLEAIEKAFPESKASKQKNRSKFRNPDNLQGFDELRKIVNGCSQTGAAREIPPFMNIENNKSESFNQFLKGFEKLLSM